MWVAFSILLVLWALSIHFYLPIVLTFGLFAGMIFSAATALSSPETHRRLHPDQL